jgi:tetratricopeptide (TPR) repeat protein
VKKQIAAIAQAVSQGHDAKAEKFLRELIQQQTSLSGGEGYVVKSLCNIAQRCADMFRTDFEVICLEKAHQLDPFDAWALVQYGDHLKRVGNYDEALRSFEKAEQLGESVVAKSSVADVYSQQGDYARAILTYKAIPNFHDKPEVLTAIADNLRKMGRMEDAQDAYDKLINSAQQGLLEYARCAVRAQAGIAEIAKRQGKHEDALRAYRGILKQEGVEDRDRRIYKLGLCNVLKLMERFDQAYAVVDEVIQQYPFAMEARFIRGSILGLIGKELEGLRDLPESSVSRSSREWLRRYYRGLLLLKLKRYEDARENLVEELPKAIASGEDKGILRMAAALWFLREGETHEADGILSEIPDIYDCHARYLSLVLKLHSATQKEDLATMNSLRERIAGLQVVDARLEKAVVALGKRNFSLALTYETDALLKLAA